MDIDSVESLDGPETFALLPLDVGNVLLRGDDQRVMRKQLLCTAAAVAIAAALTGPVRAADLAYKAPPAAAPIPAPVVTWTGPYLGFHVGWGNAIFELLQSDEREFSADRPAISGAVFGVQGGWNWQFASPFVVGIEGDWSSFRAAGLGGAGPSSGFRRNTDWLASIRGRLGMVFDNTLFYATGGVGFERGGLNTFGTKSGHVPGRTISTSFTGGVDGGGIDWRYSPHVSFRLEGLHYFFNKSVTDNFSESKLIVDRLKDVSVVRAGAVFHFDSALFGKDKAPVVAPLLANTRS